MGKGVYIVGTGQFLPNDPVPNDAINEYLSIVNTELETVRRSILMQNGIKQRYYAIDKFGKRTHTNAEMCSRAMLNACLAANREVSSVQFLSAGTTVADLLVPSYASMVHGLLSDHGARSIHVHPVHGVCCASMHAMEVATAFLSNGKYENALIGAGERLSVLMQAAHFSEEYQRQFEIAKQNQGYAYFDAEFLRYMLSDGAGALYLTTKPAPDQYAFHIDWIESISYANFLPTCMYMGDLEPDSQRPSGSWLAHASLSDAVRNGLLNLRQKTDLLKKHIVKQGIAFCQNLTERGLLNFDEISIIGAHISSKFFINEISKELKAQQSIDIPISRFYTNLKTVGNIGSASPLVIMDDIFSNKMLKPGEKCLLFVPESARFSYSIAQFTAV